MLTKNKKINVQLVERQRVRRWSGRSEVHILHRSNRARRCQRLATAETFFRKKLWHGDRSG